MNITVYLGANEGREPALKTAVCELGAWIGEHGHTLVYGGSRVGLMGAVAASTLAAGGKVIGVEPRFFIEQELQLDGLTELIVTEDMTDRKTKMIELGDAFIAFPGGTGTLEEIAEVMSKLALNHLDAPCIFYNLNGYYDHMKALLDHMIEMELSTKERQKKIYFADTLEDGSAELKMENGKWIRSFSILNFQFGYGMFTVSSNFLHTLDMGFLYPVITAGEQQAEC